MRRTIIFLAICLSVFSLHAQLNIPAANGSSTILWYNNGSIGVNNNNPQYTLDVTGFGSAAGFVLRNPVSSTDDQVLQSISGSSVYHLIGRYPGFDPNAIYIGGYNAGEMNPFVATATNKVLIGNPYYGNKYMSIDFSSGGVGIGTQSVGTCKLAVEGTIGARKVVVTVQNFPDYVFDRGYRLLPLDSLSRFVRENRHLPGVPSADSVAKSGLDLGDNQAQLLKKIEELTLYVIQLKQQIEAQNKTMADFQADIRTLKNVK